MADEVFGTINLNLTSVPFDKSGEPNLDPALKSLVSTLQTLSTQLARTYDKFQKSGGRDVVAEQFNEARSTGRATEGDLSSLADRFIEMKNLIDTLKQFNQHIQENSQDAKQLYRLLMENSRSGQHLPGTVASIVGRVRPTYNDQQVTRAGPHAPSKEERDERDISYASPAANKLFESASGIEVFFKALRAGNNPSPNYSEALSGARTDFIDRILGSTANRQEYEKTGNINLEPESIGQSFINLHKELELTQQEARQVLEDFINSLKVEFKGLTGYVASTIREGGFSPLQRFEGTPAAYGKSVAQGGGSVEDVLSGLQKNVFDPAAQKGIGIRGSMEMERVTQEAVGAFAAQSGQISDPSFRAEAGKKIAAYLQERMDQALKAGLGYSFSHSQKEFTAARETFGLVQQSRGDQGKLVDRQLDIVFRDPQTKAEETGVDLNKSIEQLHANIQKLEAEGGSEEEIAKAWNQLLYRMEGIKGGFVRDADTEDRATKLISDLILRGPGSGGIGSSRGRRGRGQVAEEADLAPQQKSVFDAEADRNLSRRQLQKMQPLIEDLKELMIAGVDAEKPLERLADILAKMKNVIGGIRYTGLLQSTDKINDTSVGDPRALAPLLGFDFPKAAMASQVSKSLRNKAVLNYNIPNPDGVGYQTAAGINDLVSNFVAKTSVREQDPDDPKRRLRVSRDVTEEDLVFNNILDNQNPLRFKPGQVISAEEARNIAPSDLSKFSKYFQPTSVGGEGVSREVTRNLLDRVLSGDNRYAGEIGSSLANKSESLRRDYGGSSVVPLLDRKTIQSMLAQELGLGDVKGNLAKVLVEDVNRPEYNSGDPNNVGGGNYEQYFRINQDKMTDFGKSFFSSLEAYFKKAAGGASDFQFRPEDVRPAINAVVKEIEKSLVSGFVDPNQISAMQSGKYTTERMINNPSQRVRSDDSGDYVVFDTGTSGDKTKNFEVEVQKWIEFHQRLTKVSADLAVSFELIRDLFTGNLARIFQGKSEFSQPLGDRVKFVTPEGRIPLTPGAPIPSTPQASSSPSAPNVAPVDASRLRSQEHAAKNIASSMDAAADATARMSQAGQSPLLQSPNVGALVSDYAGLNQQLTGIVTGFTKLQSVINSINANHLKAVAAEIAGSLTEINNIVQPVKRGAAQAGDKAQPQVVGQVASGLQDIGPIKSGLDGINNNLKRHTELFGQILTAVQGFGKGININVIQPPSAAASAAGGGAGGGRRRRPTAAGAGGGGGDEPPVPLHAQPGPDDDLPDPGFFIDQKNQQLMYRTFSRGKGGPVPRDTPVKHGHDIAALQTQNDIGYQRRATEFEYGGGTRNAVVADDLDMRLALGLAETNINRGRWKGQKVSVDEIFSQLMGDIKKYVDRTSGRLFTKDLNTGKDLPLYDFQGLGLDDDDIGRIRERDYSVPRTLNQDQQEQLFYRLLSRMEQRVAGDSARINATSPSSRAQQREMYGQQELLYNQRDPNTGAAMKTLSGTIDKDGRSVVKSITAANEAFGTLQRSAESALRRVLLWGGASFVIYGVVQQFQNMVSVAADVNDKMTKLQFLMNRTTTDFDKLSRSAFAVAKEFGSSINETLDAMVVFAQQGRTQAEVIDLVRSSLAAANQTELSATEATEALTAAMAIFNFQARDSMRVIDAWANVANNNASTADVLANALKKVGATAQFVGVDFHEFNALVATVSESTRKSGQEIGTSLKFIFQSIQSPEVVKTLEDLGVAVFATEDRMRPFLDIITDLRSRFDSMTDAQRINSLTAIASRRHYADLAVIMQNLDRVGEVVNDSQNSFGVALRNNDIVMESFNKKISVMRTTFAETGNAIANAGLLDGIEGIARVGTGLARTFSALPQIFTSSLLVVGALAYGLNTLSRVMFDFSGGSISTVTKSYAAMGVAQKIIEKQTDAEIAGILKRANAYDILNSKIGAYATGNAAKYVGDNDFSRMVFSGYNAKAHPRLSGKTPADDRDRSILAQTAGFAKDQRSQLVATYAIFGSLAAATFAGAFADSIRKNNEFGNVGREIVGSIADVAQKTFGGAGVGALFGPKGIAIGAGVGLAAGAIVELTKYADLTQLAIERSNKFAAAVKSQIDAIRQLQTEIAKLNSGDIDALTGKLSFKEFPNSDKGLDTFRRYADAIASLGKLESGPGFDATSTIKEIFGDTNGFDAGLPVGQLTSSLKDLTGSAAGLTGAMDRLRDSLELIKQANTLSYFSKLSDQLKVLSSESAGFSDQLSSSGLGQAALSPLLAFGGSGKIALNGAATIAGGLGFDQTAGYLRGRAGGIEERSAFTNLLGVGEGFNVEEIAKTAGFARQIGQYQKIFDDVIANLQTYRGFDAQTRLGTAQIGINTLVPGAADLVRDQVERAGFKAEDVNIGNLDEVIQALKTAPGDNTRAVSLLTSLAQTFAQIYQRIATLNSGTTGDSIQNQLRFNREQGFEAAVSPALQGGQINADRLKDFVKPGLQGIFNTGDTFASAVVDSVDKNGLYDVVITRQKDQLLEGFGELKKLTADGVADLFKSLQSNFENTSLSQTGVDANRFFSGMVEDVQKGLRDITTVSQRLQTVYKKQMQAFTEELKIARAAVDETVPSIREQLDLLVAQGNVSRQAIRSLFGDQSLNVSSIQTRPFETPEKGFEDTAKLTEALKNSGALERDQIRVTSELIHATKDLTAHIAEQTIKALDAATPNARSTINTKLEALEKEINSGTQQSQRASFDDFMKSVGLIRGVDRAEIEKRFSTDPREGLKYIRSEVDKQIPIGDLLASGRAPASFGALTSPISKSIFGGNPIGLLDMAKAIESSKTIVARAAEIASKVDQDNPLAKQRGVTDIGNLISDPGAFAKRIGELDAFRGSEDKTLNERLLELKDPEKVRKAMDELEQQLQSVNESIVEYRRIVQEAFSESVASSIRLIASAVDELGSNQALGEFTDRFREIISLGQGTFAVNSLAKSLIDLRDTFGRFVGPQSSLIDGLAEQIAGVTNIDTETIQRVINDSVLSAQGIQYGKVLGGAEEEFRKSLAKFDIFGDTNLTSDAINSVRGAIEKLVEQGYEPESAAIQKLAGLYDTLEQKRAAQERFFDDSKTRLLKNYAETLIKAGAPAEAFDDQLRGVIRDDKFLTKLGNQSGLIPGLDRESTVGIRQYLNEVIDGVNIASTQLRESSSIFEEFSGTKELEFNTKLVEDPALQSLRNFLEPFMGGKSFPLNFTTNLQVPGQAGTNEPPRFHTGTLAADETPAILQKGEAVIPRSLVPFLPQGILNKISSGPSGVKEVMGTMLPMFHNGAVPELGYPALLGGLRVKRGYNFNNPNMVTLDEWEKIIKDTLGLDRKQVQYLGSGYFKDAFMLDDGRVLRGYKDPADLDMDRKFGLSEAQVAGQIGNPNITAKIADIPNTPFDIAEFSPSIEGIHQTLTDEMKAALKNGDRSAFAELMLKRGRLGKMVGSSSLFERAFYDTKTANLGLVKRGDVAQPVVNDLGFFGRYVNNEGFDKRNARESSTVHRANLGASLGLGFTEKSLLEGFQRDIKNVAQGAPYDEFSKYMQPSFNPLAATDIDKRYYSDFPSSIREKLTGFIEAAKAGKMSGIQFLDEPTSDKVNFGGAYDPKSDMIFLVHGKRVANERAIRTLYHEMMHGFFKRNPAVVNPITNALRSGKFGRTEALDFLHNFIPDRGAINDLYGDVSDHALAQEMLTYLDTNDPSGSQLGRMYKNSLGNQKMLNLIDAVTVARGGFTPEDVTGIAPGFTNRSRRSVNSGLQNLQHGFGFDFELFRSAPEGSGPGTFGRAARRYTDFGAMAAFPAYLGLRGGIWAAKKSFELIKNPNVRANVMKVLRESARAGKAISRPFINELKASFPGTTEFFKSIDGIQQDQLLDLLVAAERELPFSFIGDQTGLSDAFLSDVTRVNTIGEGGVVNDLGVKPGSAFDVTRPVLGDDEFASRGYDPRFNPRTLQKLIGKYEDTQRSFTEFVFNDARDRWDQTLKLNKGDVEIALRTLPRKEKADAARYYELSKKRAEILSQIADQHGQISELSYKDRIAVLKKLTGEKLGSKVPSLSLGVGTRIGLLYAADPLIRALNGEFNGKRPQEVGVEILKAAGIGAGIDVGSSVAQRSLASLGARAGLLGGVGRIGGIGLTGGFGALGIGLGGASIARGFTGLAEGYQEGNAGQVAGGALQLGLGSYLLTGGASGLAATLGLTKTAAAIGSVATLPVAGAVAVGGAIGGYAGKKIFDAGLADEGTVHGAVLGGIGRLATSGAERRGNLAASTGADTILEGDSPEVIANIRRLIISGDPESRAIANELIESRAAAKAAVQALMENEDLERKRKQIAEFGNYGYRELDNLPRFRMGQQPLAADEVLAVLHKGEAVVPAHLVKYIPQDVMDKIPAGLPREGGSYRVGLISPSAINPNEQRKRKEQEIRAYASQANDFYLKRLESIKSGAAQFDDAKKEIQGAEANLDQLTSGIAKARGFDDKNAFLGADTKDFNLGYARGEDGEYDQARLNEIYDSLVKTSQFIKDMTRFLPPGEGAGFKDYDFELLKEKFQKSAIGDTQDETAQNNRQTIKNAMKGLTEDFDRIISYPTVQSQLLKNTDQLKSFAEGFAKSDITTSLSAKILSTLSRTVAGAAGNADAYESSVNQGKAFLEEVNKLKQAPQLEANGAVSFTTAAGQKTVIDMFDAYKRSMAEQLGMQGEYVKEFMFYKDFMSSLQRPELAGIEKYGQTAAAGFNTLQSMVGDLKSGKLKQGQDLTSVMRKRFAEIGVTLPQEFSDGFLIPDSTTIRALTPSMLQFMSAVGGLSGDKLSKILPNGLGVGYTPNAEDEEFIAANKLALGQWLQITPARDLLNKQGISAQELITGKTNAGAQLNDEYYQKLNQQLTQAVLSDPEFRRGIELEQQIAARRSQNQQWLDNWITQLPEAGKILNSTGLTREMLIDGYDTNGAPLPQIIYQRLDSEFKKRLGFSVNGVQNLPRYHTGMIAQDEHMAVVQKGEVLVPRNLVPALPDEVLDRIPGANIERIRGERKETVAPNQNIDVKIPTNVQVVYSPDGKGPSADDVRAMLNEVLEGKDLLKKIMEAPLNMIIGR